MPTLSDHPRFALGNVVTTPGADQLLRKHDHSFVRYIARHLHGDWGDVPPEDAQSNEDALETGARLLSAYTLPDGEKLWLITEADRSATTFLLPSEY